jgi:hypothetical protein
MRFLFLLIFLLTAFVSLPQKHILLDSSDVSIRSFNGDDLQKFKEDKDFQYRQLQQPLPNLWVRFWRWVWWKVAEIMRTKSGRRTVYTSVTIVAVAAIVFFVIRVMGMNKSGLLSRNSNGNYPFTIDTEDINSISFEDAIRDAVQSRNFRLAVRLLYLQSLKQLSDKGHIEWQINKTNADYVKEVADKPWQSLFRKITYTFDGAWYGEMNIGSEEFEQVNLQFQQFNNQLQ